MLSIRRLNPQPFFIAIAVSYAIVIALAVLNVPTEILLPVVCLNSPWMVILYIGRLHDAGYSGWWWPLVMFTSILGLIALAASPSQKRENKYGDVPLGSLSELIYFWRSARPTAGRN